MKTLIKLLLLVAVVGYFGFAAVKFMAPSNDELCAGLNVRIEGELPAGSDVTVDSASVAHLLGQYGILPARMRMSQIDLLLVDSVLGTDPFIRTVRSYKNAMNMLCIDIALVKPVVHVLDSRGADYYIDGVGVVIPASGHYLPLPVVTGQINQRWASTYLPRLVSHIQADEYWAAEIEQINVQSDSTVTLVPRHGDHLIHMGRVEDVDGKLERLRLFYAQGLDRVGWNRYTDINVEYDNQVICTKNNNRITKK